jgi:hypothetical protein
MELNTTECGSFGCRDLPWLRDLALQLRRAPVRWVPFRPTGVAQGVLEAWTAVSDGDRVSLAFLSAVPEAVVLGDPLRFGLMLAGLLTDTVLPGGASRYAVEVELEMGPPGLRSTVVGASGPDPGRASTDAAPAGSSGAVLGQLIDLLGAQFGVVEGSDRPLGRWFRLPIAVGHTAVGRPSPPVSPQVLSPSSAPAPTEPPHLE